VISLSSIVAMPRANAANPAASATAGGGLIWAASTLVTSDIASAHIVISGTQVMLCDGDQLVDVLRQGQGVLNVLPLAGVKDDIDAQLVPLDDDAVAAGPRRAI